VHTSEPASTSASVEFLPVLTTSNASSSSVLSPDRPTWLNDQSPEQ
jgi:hypothetical protein